MSRILGTAAACLLLSGCISIPDDVQAELAPPDGTRPNNYGLFVEGAPGTWHVTPDQPTIAPLTTAAPTPRGS